MLARQLYRLPNSWSPGDCACLYSLLHFIMRLTQDNRKYEDARQLLQQACEQAKDGGHPGACYRLGMFLATGEHYPEDSARCALLLASPLFAATTLYVIRTLTDVISCAVLSTSSARAASSATRSRASMSFSTRRTSPSDCRGSLRLSNNNNNKKLSLFVSRAHDV